MHEEEDTCMRICHRMVHQHMRMIHDQYMHEQDTCMRMCHRMVHQDALLQQPYATPAHELNERTHEFVYCVGCPKRPSCSSPMLLLLVIVGCRVRGVVWARGVGYIV